jgi:hypothetical protein
MILPKNMTVLIQPMNQGIIWIYKPYYWNELYAHVVKSEVQVTEFLKTLTLNDFVYNVGLAWRKISPI